MNETKTPRLDAKAKHLNEGIALDAFDYGKMVGKPFEEYRNMVEGEIIDEDDPKQRRAGGIDSTKKYVFDIYKVTPVYKRLFPKSTIDTTQILAGFSLEKSAPIRSTTTFLKHALLLNGQLESKQVSGNGSAITYEYYLLQKHQ